MPKLKAIDDHTLEMGEAAYAGFRTGIVQVDTIWASGPDRSFRPSAEYGKRVSLGTSTRSGTPSPKMKPRHRWPVHAKQPAEIRETATHDWNVKDMSHECSKCNSAMEMGFLLEKGDAGTLSAETWVSGEPKKSLLSGLNLKGRVVRDIKTFRCIECGYLESYAS